MPGPSVQIDVVAESADPRAVMSGEVAAGLRATPKRLPSKYFYDERGSRLFERITELPEYYPTRTEEALLDARAAEMTEPGPVDLVELGSGTGHKTRRLIRAARGHGRLERYIPLEVSAETARRSAEELAAAFPGLSVHVVVGDFLRHLDRIPPGTGRLVAILGGTIGNFPRERAVHLLREIRDLVGSDGRLLLGTDLVKDTGELEAAYNDSQGVTAEFNRNILRVINDRLGADFDVDAFEHVAFFDRSASRIEMHLRSLTDQTVSVPPLRLEVPFERGEMLRTELSHKYRREDVRAMLREAGLEMRRWFTDPRERFAVSLSAAS